MKNGGAEIKLRQKTLSIESINLEFIKTLEDILLYKGSTKKRGSNIVLKLIVLPLKLSLVIFKFFYRAIK